MALLDQLDGLFEDFMRIPGLSDADKTFIAEKRAAIPALLRGARAAWEGGIGKREVPASLETLRDVHTALAESGAVHKLAPFESLAGAMEGAAVRDGTHAFPSAEKLNEWGIALDTMSPRVPGTESMDRTADYLIKELSSFGPDAWSESLDFRGVFFHEWSFALSAPKRKSFVAFPQNNVAFGDLEANLIDVGRGRESDYRDVDAKGKIVLVNWGRLWDHEGPCAARRRYGLLHLYDLAYIRGAAGMVGYFEDMPGNSLKLVEPGIKPVGGSNVFGPSEA